MTPSPRPTALRVHAVLVAVQVAFASLSVAGKLVVRSLEPSALALVRLAGAALVFTLLGRRAPKATPIPGRDLAAIAGCALLGIVGNQLMFLHGLRLTSAVNATVLVATIPIFTVLAAVGLGRERIGRRAALGVACAFAGVVWLVGGESASFGGEGRLVGEGRLGDLLVLGNSVVYALYLVLVRDLVARHGSLRVVTIGFTFGALVVLPFGAMPLVGAASALPHAVWLLVAYVVLVPTVFTYLANAWALRFAPSSTVAIFIYVQPVVAAALAALVLGEVPGPRVPAAALAVFAGVWLVTRPSSPRPAP